VKGLGDFFMGFLDDWISYGLEGTVILLLRFQFLVFKSRSFLKI
jgi:hypothetical protein